MDLVEMETTGYDVITISETRLGTDDRQESISPGAYHDVISKDINENRRGVALYVKTLWELAQTNLDVLGFE